MPSRTAPSRPIAAELRRGPADGEQRRLEAAAGHRLGAQPVALAQHDRAVGTVRLAPATNMRAKWRTVAVRSAAGPTMKPGVSHRNSTGSSKASHSCMKRRPCRRRRRRSRRRDGWGRWRSPPAGGRRRARARSPSRRRSRGAARAPSPRRTAPRHAADVVDALALLGDRARAAALVGHRAGSARPVEVGEVAPGRARPPRVVGDAQIDHAVGVLHVDRADLLGS